MPRTELPLHNPERIGHGGRGWGGHHQWSRVHSSSRISSGITSSWELWFPELPSPRWGRVPPLGAATSLSNFCSALSWEGLGLVHCAAPAQCPASVNVC